MSVYNSTGVFTAGTCRDILIDLMDVTRNENLPFLKRTPTGYLDFLTSPLNTGGIEIIPIQQGEKEVDVVIKYRARGVESEVREVETSTCEPDSFPDYAETTVSLDQVASVSFGLKPNEFAKVCEGQSKFITDTLYSKFDALARSINRTALEQQALNFGINQETNSVATKSINVMVASTGAPLATGLQELKSDYVISNLAGGNPAIIGAGNFYKYWTTLKAGCCNDTGVDMLALSQGLGAAYFVDTMVDSVLGANQIVVMEPSTTHFVPYNRYVGAKSMMATDVHSQGLITDPRTGITYDLKTVYDECEEEWFFKMSLHWTLFFQPNDVYNGQDPLYQTNGTFRYTAATT